MVRSLLSTSQRVPFSYLGSLLSLSGSPCGLGSGYGDEIASIAPSMSTEEIFKAPQATGWMLHEASSGQPCVAGMAESRPASDNGSNLEEFIHAYSGYEGDDSASDGNHVQGVEKKAAGHGAV